MTLTTAFFAYVKGEKSQAELDGYRRAVSRIDELEAGLENETRGRAPWDLPEHLEQALVFSWIARGLATIANTLLESDELEDPLTAGYLPVVTFDQAKALYQQVPPVLEKAWEALANPRFKTDRPLPQFLGPRIEAEGTCPLVHLKGIQAAASSPSATTSSPRSRPGGPSRPRRTRRRRRASGRRSATTSCSDSSSPVRRS